MVRDAELGRRYADKLAEVYTLDGVEPWVLVHIEIQGRRMPGSPSACMFTTTACSIGTAGTW